MIYDHFDDIQRSVYRNSCNVVDRKSGVVFYDCTNYYFEIEQEDEDLPPGDHDSFEEMEEKKGLRKYASSTSLPPSFRWGS